MAEPCLAPVVPVEAAVAAAPAAVTRGPQGLVQSSSQCQPLEIPPAVSMEVPLALGPIPVSSLHADLGLQVTLVPALEPNHADQCLALVGCLVQVDHKVREGYPAQGGCLAQACPPVVVQQVSAKVVRVIPAAEVHPQGVEAASVQTLPQQLPWPQQRAPLPHAVPEHHA